MKWLDFISLIKGSHIIIFPGKIHTGVQAIAYSIMIKVVATSVFFTSFSSESGSMKPTSTQLRRPILLDPQSSAPNYGWLHGHGHHEPSTPPISANISWLRKLEHILSDSSAPLHHPCCHWHVCHFFPHNYESPTLPLHIHITYSSSVRQRLLSYILSHER